MLIKVVFSDLHPLPPSLTLEAARRYLEAHYVGDQIEVTRGPGPARVHVSTSNDQIGYSEASTRATRVEICRMLLDLLCSHWETCAEGKL